MRKNYCGNIAICDDFSFVIIILEHDAYSRNRQTLKLYFGIIPTQNKTKTDFRKKSSSDDNAFFKFKNPSNAGVPPGKVTLSAVRWMLPRCSPSDVARYELYKQIKAEIVLDVGFRMRQCISTTVQKSTQFTWRMGIRPSPESP